MPNFKEQQIIFNKKGYSLFNRAILKKANCKKIIRIWTGQKFQFEPNSFIEDDICYILEGTGNHPHLKSAIINAWNEKYNHFTETIYMYEKEYEDYQKYAYNGYRLSQKFINNNNIIYLNNKSSEDFGLNIDMTKVTLIIQYECSDLGIVKDDYILRHFNENIWLAYE